jgi:hypothetical protein
MPTSMVDQRVTGTRQKESVIRNDGDGTLQIVVEFRGARFNLFDRDGA